MSITEIYSKNIQLLSTLEGADRIMNHVSNMAQHFWQIQGVSCVMGVGYPYYFSSGGRIQINPEEIREYRQYNASRLAMMQKALNGRDWNCPSCPNLKNSRECCYGGNVTVYEVMRSVCDADMFVVIDDSQEDIFEQSFNQLQKAILQNPNLRTWDQDLQKGIADYINDDALFTDIHVIRTSQLSQALDQLATFIELAVNFDDKTDDIETLAPIIQTRINDIAWRGRSDWSNTHELPLIWDLLISGRPIFQSLQEPIMQKIHKIGGILANDRERCRRVLQIATQIYKPGNKEERFVFQEDIQVIEAMITSLLSAFPIQVQEM